MGRHVTLKNGLTPKQNKFTKILLKQIAEDGTMNAADAAQIAYDVKSRSVARSVATENLSKPLIKKTIEESLNQMGLSQDTFLNEISAIAQTREVKITGDVKLKANLELLKLLGGYKKAQGNATKQTFETLTFDEATNTIKRLTQELSTFSTEAE